jgi:hypothetical protein
LPPKNGYGICCFCCFCSTSFTTFHSKSMFQTGVQVRSPPDTSDQH